MSVGLPDEKPSYARVRIGPVALLRACIRLPLLVVVTLMYVLGWGLLALWPWSRAGRAALRRGVSRRWAGAMCRVLGARIKVLGELPEGPGFLITNHVGYLDIPVLMSLTGCRFVSKREVADWPFIGFLARKAGTLFVNRGNAGRDAGMTLDGMARALEDGDLVVFFPEGTTSPGERILPFRSGLLSLPARDGHPVWPAALAYETGDAEIDPGLALAWWGGQNPVEHLWRLVCMPGFTVRIAVAHAVEAAHRKHLAQALHHRVALMHAGLSGAGAGVSPAVLAAQGVEIEAPAPRRQRLIRHTALICAALMLAVTTLSAFVRLANLGLGGGPETDAVLMARGAHRIAASTVLLVVIALLALSLGPRPYLYREGKHALALLALAVFLAVLGRWSSGAVASPVVLGNLLGGFVMFALCWRLAFPESHPLAPRLEQLARLAAAVVLLQVGLGALALAAHRYSAVAVLLLLAPFAVALWRTGQRSTGLALLVLLFAQLTLGVVHFSTGQPLELVLAHNIVGLLLLATLLRVVRIPALS